jgi:hypothetical protein
VSAIDLHPEDLLDRARRGVLSADEAARLRAHLAGCSACRFEHVLADDCALSEDDSAITRVQRAAARAVRERRGGAFAARGRRRPTRLVYAVAGLFVFAATVAAATTVVRRVWHGPVVEPVRSDAPVAVRPHRHRAAAVTPPADEGAAAEVDETLAVEPPSAEVPVQPAPRARPRAVASAESPAELFARANAARRGGHTREAARLYHELQRQFPGSSEELVSRVTLGRWMLDRLNNPAGALVRFDSYLANPVHTALREEALIGRALALGRLGRETEERSAWTAFLAAFPGSVYAERARGRLEALR